MKNKYKGYVLVDMWVMLQLHNKLGYMANGNNQILDSVGNQLGFIEDIKENNKKVSENIWIKKDAWELVKHSLKDSVEDKPRSKEYLEIVKSLEPLILEAKRRNLWFYNNRYDLWLSPKELESNLKDGRYVWGPVKWELKSPYEKLIEMENFLKNYQMNLDEFKLRIEDVL